MHRVVKEYAIRSNRMLPLVDYLVPLVGDKKEVKILDAGSGPYATTGQLLDGVKIDVTYCDRKIFKVFWAELGIKPLHPIQYQDIEKLTYPDRHFDIVHCLNALDHTENAEQALKELIRVCKGWVYVECSLDQLTLQRKRHYWDAKYDGKFINKEGQFDLRDYGFEIEFKDGQVIGRRQC